jgi:hypothetical protein
VELLEQRCLLDGNGLNLLPPVLVTPPQSPPDNILPPTPPTVSVPSDPTTPTPTPVTSDPTTPQLPTDNGPPTPSLPPAVPLPPVFDTVQASRFITALYLDFLHRLPAQVEVTPWVNVMAGGWGRGQVALAFTSATEYRADLINSAYRQYLGRDAEPAGLNGWLNALQGGLSEDGFRAYLLGSAEAYARAGNQPGGWVKYAYENALGREPEPAALAGWTHFLQTGGTPITAANYILGSPEAHAHDVALAYPELLGRAADAPGLLGWASALNQGLAVSQMWAGLAASPEYLLGPAGSDLPAVNNQGASPTSVLGLHGGLAGTGFTNDPLLAVQGTGTDWVPVVISVDNVPEGYARVGPGGGWQIDLPGPVLEGTHEITVRPVGVDSPESVTNSSQITVALTAPQVTATVIPGPSAATPIVVLQVTPGPLAGLTGVGHVAVDLNHDGNFTGPGEQNQTQFNVGAGMNQVVLNALPPGTYQAEAQVTDQAGNTGVSQVFTFQSDAGTSSAQPNDDPHRIKVLPATGTSLQPNANNAPLGSQALEDLVQNYVLLQASLSSNIPGPTGPGGPAPGFGWQSLDDFLAFEKHYYVFDAHNDVLVRVRFDTLADMGAAQARLQSLGMTVTEVSKTQLLTVGYLPLAAVLMLPEMVNGFAGATPVYAAIQNVGAVTTQGDGATNADQYRALAGVDGTGVTVGAISDSVNQVDSHVDANPDKGVAESQRTGDLPASGVNILQDGPATATDEGRGMLEIVHDIAPGASLAFTTSVDGPQAMAQGIVALATQAGAKVIVDDVTYPDEPFFNDGVVAQAVDQVVNQNHVVYVTSAGNFANHAWTDQYRGVTASVGPVSGQFENFDAGAGQQVLQHFSLAKGQTLDLSFQWDAPFLEGGSPDPNFQVPNNLAVLVTDAAGDQVLQTFDDNTEVTGEAMQRVIFTNNGSFGTTDFALAFELVDGPAPTRLKWVRFDNGAPAEFQGAPAVFGHAAAQGAITVGAVPYGDPQTPEAFSSQGPATILFDVGGHRLHTPEVRDKPDVAGPDGVFTANFPGLPAGQSLPPGTFPVFTGTSAAAAHVAGVAALLAQKTPTALGGDVTRAVLKAAQDGGANWDSQAGAGLVQMTPTLAAAPPATADLTVGRIVDVSAPLPKPHTSGNGSSGQVGGNQFLNAGPANVDASMRTNNEFEEDIAIDPTNPQRMFLFSNEDTVAAALFGAFSTDAGVTWTGRFMADGTDGLTAACCDPSAAWDNFGNLFITYLDSTLGLAVVGLSTDGGQTFKQLATFSATDQPKVAVGPGSVWVVYNNTNDLDAAGAAVTGPGAVGSFGSPEIVPTSTGSSNFGNITVGPKGQVLVSYQDASSGVGPDTIFTALDPDGLGAAGFNNPIAASPTNVGAFRPITPQPMRTIDTDGRLAFDDSNGPHRGRVYLDYVDAADTTTNDTNIFVRFSDDDGTTWSNPVRVNDDTGTNSQFWPRLKVDPTTGNVAVSWYDCRNDTGSGPGDTDGVPNDDAEMFATISFNGGVSFLPNQQVAAGPSSAIANPNNGNEYGDYTGLAFVGGTFYPAWADNSNSTGTNPDGHLAGFDVYTAPVVVSSVFNFSNLGDDRFEPNDTSDRATNFGPLNPGTFAQPALNIDRHANGLFDYDWYRWTVTQSGTVTVTINNIVSNGDLNTRVFTLNRLGTLIELGSSTLQGVTAQAVSVHVTAGEPLLVWVYGFNHALGTYDMTLDLV